MGAQYEGSEFTESAPSRAILTPVQRATTLEPATTTTTTTTATPVRRGLLRQIPAAIGAMRIRQWTKNGLVLLAAIFSLRLLDLGTMGRVVLAFFAFSLAASAIYIVNDLVDRDKDRLHPRKRLRPIASGRLSVPFAVIVAMLCIAGSAALAFVVARDAVKVIGDPFVALGGSGPLFAFALASYVALNVLYSSVFKHLVLWDVFAIAGGFVLRAIAGAFAAAVLISPWFYLTAVFLSLFLALGKRRAELVQMEGRAGSSRRTLLHYTPQLLDQLITVVVTCVLVAYSLYTFEGLGANHQLMITIPFVIFGVFRYLYLMYVKAEGEQPDELLVRDRQILGAVVLCVTVVVALLYGGSLLNAAPAVLHGLSLP